MVDIRKKEFTFINPDRTLKSNLMAFGYECGDGWLNIIDECFTKIENYLKDKDIVFEVTQVKEKFASLRIYYVGGDDYIDKLIDDTCNESMIVCENCGSKEMVSTKSIRGWYYTRCKNCMEELSKNEKKYL